MHESRIRVVRAILVTIVTIASFRSEGRQVRRFAPANMRMSL